MPKASPAAKTAPSIGSLIDTAFDLREQERELESQKKKLTAQRTEIEEQILAKFEAEGVDQIRGTKATASLSENEVANVENWDDFYKYIHRQKAFHLLQRRVSDAAWREERMTVPKHKIPGTTPFNKKSVSLKTL